MFPREICELHALYRGSVTRPAQRITSVLITRFIALTPYNQSPHPNHHLLRVEGLFPGEICDLDALKELVLRTNRLSGGQ